MVCSRGEARDLHPGLNDSLQGPPVKQASFLCVLLPEGSGRLSNRLEAGLGSLQLLLQEQASLQHSWDDRQNMWEQIVARAGTIKIGEV